MATNPSRDLLAQLEALDGQPRVTYPSGSTDYPTTERVQTLMRGKAPLVFLSAEPDTTRFPNNVLVEQQIVGSTHTHVRLYTKYERLPGRVLTEETYDSESDTFIIRSQTRKATSAITESITLVTAMHPYTITLIEREPLDDATSTELVTTWTEPAARDAGTQIETREEVEPYSFPAVMNDFEAWLATTGILGYSAPFTARIPVVTKSFWTFASSRPALSLDGVLLLATIDNIIGNGIGIKDIVIDDEEFDILGLLTVAVHESTPNATTYLADYVGESKSVAGGVKMDGNRYRWKTDRKFITYIEQAHPTYAEITP